MFYTISQIVCLVILHPQFFPIFKTPSSEITLSQGPDPHPLLIQAEASYNKRDFDEAIRYFKKALQEPQVQKDPPQLIKAKTLLGSSYTLTRSFDEALSILNEALQIAQNLPQKEHLLVAESHYHIGVYFDQTGEGDKALLHHKEALRIRLKSLEANDVKIAESLNGLGEVYLYTIHDYQKARDNFRNAVKIFEGSHHVDPYSLYTLYFNIASSSRNIGDAEMALTYAFKALSVVQSSEEYQSKLEKCYTLIGNIYFAETDFPTAIQYMAKGIEESISNRGADNYELILKYMNLGLAYAESGDIQKALQCFQRSLMINRLPKHLDPMMEANNYFYMGIAFQMLQEFDSAAYYLKECYSIQLAHNGPKHFRTSKILLYVAQLFREFNHLDSAAIYIQKSLIASAVNFNDPNIHANPNIENSDNPTELFRVFGYKGSILRDQYLANPKNLKALETSLICFKAADQLMEMNRRAYQAEGSKLFFADHYHNIYEDALEVSFLLFQKTQLEQYISDALTFMEKSKAILLAESLQKAEMYNASGIPDSIGEKERNLSGELAHYKSQLEDHKLKNGHEEEYQHLQSEIFQLTRKRENLMNEIARQFPNYFFIKYQSLATLAQTREYASKNDAMVLEYFWGDDRVFLISISRNKVAFNAIEHPDSLASNISTYYDELLPGRSATDGGEKFDTFYANAQAIYHRLLSPALSQNDNIGKLILIRDGPLLLIPFESLPVSANRSSQKNFQAMDYLLRHYAISYAHSASLLIKNATRIKTSSHNRVLAFSYSGLPGVENKNVRTGQPAIELPGTARELEAIAGFFTGEFLKGDEATEENFKAMAADYDILHLALHGTGDKEKQFSGSLLFKHSAEGIEDGNLQLYELYNMTLRAKLAVLSACESGVGKVFKGEGVFSIARGFDYAGCPSTVMTLWKVSDMTSARIMSDFYKALKEGTPIDESLRQAKLRYLETADTRLTHPTFWAAFIPSGSMDPITRPNHKPIVLVALMTLMAGSVTFYFLRKFLNRQKIQPSGR